MADEKHAGPWRGREQEFPSPHAPQKRYKPFQDFATVRVVPRVQPLAGNEAMVSTQLTAVGAALDGIEVGFCVFDDDGRVLAWNSTFVGFFPEHDGKIKVGEPYSEQLVRSTARKRAEDERLTERDQKDRLGRSRTQWRPCEYNQRDARVTVSSIELEQLGWVRVWRKVAEPQTVLAHKPPRTQMLAHLDLATVLGRLADGVLVVDIADKVVWANSAFLNLYGVRSFDSACGQAFEGLYRAAWAGQEWHPAFRTSIVTLLDNQRFAGAPYELALPGDRFVCVIEHRGEHQGRGYCEHVDITDLKRQQAALAEAEQRYRLLAEYSSDIILSVEGGVITYASPAVTELLGWRADEVLGTLVVGYCHPADVEPVAQALRATDGNRHQLDYRARVLHRDGRFVWVEARARNLPCHTGSLVTRRVVNLRGIEARKAVEEELELAKERLQALATTDPLTGLSNRRRLDDVLLLEFRRCQRDTLPLSALLIDIDHFKLLNDSHGHAIGDQVLKSMAALLQSLGQRAGDLVVRLGGDEFLIVLPGTDSAQAAFVADDLVRRVGQTAFAAPVKQVTVSVGVSTLDPSAAVHSSDELLSLADNALYEAKRSGRNRSVTVRVQAAPKA